MGKITKESNEIDTLILSPHADDEVLGAFSFLGPRTFVAYFGIEDRVNISRDERMEELKAVAKHCGFQWKVFDFPVNNYNAHQLISPIEMLTNKLQPIRLLLPVWSYNQDHRAVFQSGVTASRPHDENWFCSEVLLFEQPHNAIWSDIVNFKPNFFREININAKIDAYKLHGSQVRPHRSPEVLKALAKIRGASAGIEFAEAYQQLRRIELHSD